MTISKVYFADFHATINENLLQKLVRLVKKAGMEKIDFDRKFAALKIHFGEAGNLSYLRPNYVRALVDLIRSHQGKPFLTDCNTLYVGGRKNALDHIETAYVNGFSPFSTGCHIIIGDGLKGTDDALVPFDGTYIKEAKIGRAIVDADIIISITHFKMHECTGIGGAIKNIGMGCGSRAGKMDMHAAGKPNVVAAQCVNCGMCRKQCAQNAIGLVKGKAKIDHSLCVGCGRCIGACPRDAIEPPYDQSFDVLNCKIAEYAAAVCKDKPSFHISFVCDVSPFCDCHSENDLAVVPNIGMFASFDPVALDMACTDMVNQQEPIRGSLLDKSKKNGDHFSTVHPTTNWRTGLEHAVKCGLGSMEYELIQI